MDEDSSDEEILRLLGEFYDLKFLEKYQEVSDSLKKELVNSYRKESSKELYINSSENRVYWMHCGSMHNFKAEDDFGCAVLYTMSSKEQ